MLRGCGSGLSRCDRMSPWSRLSSETAGRKQGPGKREPPFSGGSPVIRGLSASTYTGSGSGIPCQPPRSRAEGKIFGFRSLLLGLLFLCGLFLHGTFGFWFAGFLRSFLNWHRYPPLRSAAAGQAPELIAVAHYSGLYGGDYRNLFLTKQEIRYPFYKEILNWELSRHPQDFSLIRMPFRN